MTLKLHIFLVDTIMERDPEKEMPDSCSMVTSIQVLKDKKELLDLLQDPSWIPKAGKG